MNQVIKLRFTKSEQKLITWWKEVSKVPSYDRPKAIRSMLEYYIRTHEVLQIAKVKLGDEPYKEMMGVELRIPVESDLYKWLESEKAKGERTSSLIKDILSRAIGISEETTWLRPVEDIRNSLDNTYKQFTKPTAVEEIPRLKESVVKEQPKESPPDKEVQGIEPIKKEEPKTNNPGTDEFDYSAAFGFNSFGSGVSSLFASNDD